MFNSEFLKREMNPDENGQCFQKRCLVSSKESVNQLTELVTPLKATLHVVTNMVVKDSADSGPCKHVFNFCKRQSTQHYPTLTASERLPCRPFGD
jgi:hypothetical protein